MKALERLQKKATLWIMNYPSDNTYKERHERLKLLLVSLYFELHDFFLLLDILASKYDYDFSEQLRGIVTKTRQGTKNEFAVKKRRLKKADCKIFDRTLHLLNILQRKLISNADIINKKTLTDKYWRKFLQYNENDSCSWRILCLCGNCRPMPSSNSNNQNSC